MSSAAAPNLPWYRELSRYQWFVLIVAMLGWLFDTMDQQLFNLARAPAVEALLPNTWGGESLGTKTAAGLTTMIFMIGWATGGIIFGIMGDRVGRAKTMMATILVYSAFTGLSALSVSLWDFSLYRFLSGLGVGGEFAVGVALVAEVMHDRVRTPALSALQASSTIGNCTAALIGMTLGLLKLNEVIDTSPWRGMFVVGALPAIMVLFIMNRLKEPERWQAQSKDGSARKAGSLGELFGNAELRRRVIVGLMLGFAGVVGLWGIGFFSFDLSRTIFRETFEAELVAKAVADGRLTGQFTPEERKARLNAPTPEERTAFAAEPAEVARKTFLGEDAQKRAITGNMDFWIGVQSLFQNLGGFCGVVAFGWFTERTGRRLAFFLAFILAMAGTAFTFLTFSRLTDIFWLIPILGFCQLTVFGGFAVYFPELFPTRLRSTGTSFCYNVGRYLAAPGPLLLGVLNEAVFQKSLGFGEVESFRYAGVTMCAFFFVGLAALPFAPETKGKPLPE